MRTRAMHTECKLYYDSPAHVEVGHFLRSNGGSVYFVTEVRRNSKRRFRKHLRCLRWPPAELPDHAVVHPICWYPRRKRPRM
jgi:hypothetical protein